jgi:hypothetical protein
MQLRRLPAWLRRGLEAGLFATVLALLIVFVVPRGAGAGVARTLGSGPDGPLAMALPVLAIGVFAVTYPIMLAATRSEAILAAILAVVVAADLVTMLTAAMGDRIALHGGYQVLPSGLLATLLAVPSATIGLAASQLFSRFGFGRQAGRIAGVSSAVVALGVLFIGVPMVA